MMAYLGSLRDMLNTGRLGPLYPGMPLREVADILGPPKYWIWNEEHSAPNYWGYGNFELSAEFGENPYCDWFQFDNAHMLRGDSEVINENFAVTLDGLSVESRISDFIRAVDDIARVVVQLVGAGGYYNPIVFIGDRAALNFSRENDTPDAQVQDLGTLIRLTDAESDIVDIYSFSSPYNTAPILNEELRHLRISGAQYLSHLPEK